MILGSLESYNSALPTSKFIEQKTGWDRLKPVFDRSTYFKIVMDHKPDRGCGPNRSFPVAVWSSLGLWAVPGLDFQTLMMGCFFDPDLSSRGV